MKVGNSKVVDIHFTLTNQEGVVLEDTHQGEPFSYIHGAGNIIEGLEDALDELQIDAEFDVAIPPEKAYGVYDVRMVQEIPKEHFPEDIELAIGQQFLVQTPKGPQPITIKEIREDVVQVDGNHELAGKTLHYAGKVVSIREATEAELKHGQLGSPCCSGGTCSEEE